jgi:hypothetical protein
MQGPTTIAVVPPYPMEETSDSEADSWAQTDGTVGSLEERLDDVRDRLSLEERLDEVRGEI